MLTLGNLSFDVGDEEREVGIIKDVSFTVDDGKFAVMVGPNGGGKSIMAKLIMGTGRPTGGHILFDGQGITDMSITDRANLGIGFASQQPVRFRGVQVTDLFRLAARKKPTVSEVCQYLAGMGLCTKDYINREVSTSLSDGESKRIEIATVITRTSKLSIFDEPKVGTDLRSFQNLIQVLERIRQNTNSSILIISHREQTLSIANEIVAIADGKVANQGTRDEIMPQTVGTTSAMNACSKFYEITQ